MWDRKLVWDNVYYVKFDRGSGNSSHQRGLCLPVLYSKSGVPIINSHDHLLGKEWNRICMELCCGAAFKL